MSEGDLLVFARSMGVLDPFWYLSAGLLFAGLGVLALWEARTGWRRALPALLGLLFLALGLALYAFQGVRAEEVGRDLAVRAFQEALPDATPQIVQAFRQAAVVYYSQSGEPGVALVLDGKVYPLEVRAGQVSGENGDGG